MKKSDRSSNERNFQLLLSIGAKPKKSLLNSYRKLVINRIKSILKICRSIADDRIDAEKKRKKILLRINDANRLMVNNKERNTETGKSTCWLWLINSQRFYFRKDCSTIKEKQI
jgi:DNA-directed RNA polymerase beta' subunit